jgi:DNA-binding transcriptional LysR family regulator
MLANTSAAESLLPAAVTEFLARNPEVDLEIEEAPSHQIVSAVGEGRAELGVIADTVDVGSLECVALRPDPLVVVAHTHHPLAGRAHVTFSDCLKYPFVGFVNGNPLQEHLSGQAQPLGLRPRYRARLCNTEAICRAVSAAVGIAVLPELAVSRWRRQLDLVVIALTNTWAQRSLLLCSDKWSGLSDSGAKLAAHLTAHTHVP